MSVGSANIRDELLADAGWLPHKLEPAIERILFLRLTEADYHRASFLDDRIVTPQTEGRWLGFDQVTNAVAGALPAVPLQFIFHAGHVGSTLVSRLLEGADGVLPVREPLALRSLADLHDGEGALDSIVAPDQLRVLLTQHTTLWRRGFAGTRTVILKATSSAARLGSRLLAHLPDARALYLNLPLEPYLATLLAGENSRADLRGFAGERVRRLQAMGVPLDKPAYALSDGELAALTWTAERLTQQRLAEAFGARVLSLDFDDFLTTIEPSLRRIAAHFSLHAPESFFAGVELDPILARYAKAPEHIYSPGVRAEILAATRARKADEIRRGAIWVESLARRCGAVAAVCSR
jgi:hypothetical protein